MDTASGSAKTVRSWGNSCEPAGAHCLANNITERQPDHIDSLRTSDLRQNVLQIICRTEYRHADVRPFGSTIHRLGYRAPVRAALHNPYRRPHDQRQQTIAELSVEHDGHAPVHPRASAPSAGAGVV